MSDSCVKYVQDELIRYKDRLQCIQDDIRSSEIELKTIEKNLNKLIKEKDWTEDILHSTSISSEESDVRILTLKNNKSDLSHKLVLLNKERDELTNKIESLKDILNSDSNVSCETLEQPVNIINYIESERQRISRDIHDTVVQNLTALIHKQEFINQIIDKDINRCKLEISNSISLIKNSVNELRNIIFELRPMSLDDLGFKTAIINLIQRIDKETENVIYNTSVICDDNLNIDSAISISVMRIINELNSNAIKHSGCSHINICIEVNSSRIILKFSDDGSGFNYDECIQDRDNHTGFGIIMLRERVSLLKGNLHYVNDKGSHFTIEIPIS